jgi:hypothetical protein
METKHTPGPWLVTKDRWGALCVNNHDAFASEFPVAAVNGAGDEEKAANARLIAAAPDLIAALTFMLADYEEAYGGDEKDEPVAMSAARAALAKAQG